MNAWQNPGKYTYRAMTITTGGSGGYITASGDVATVDVRDLSNVTMYMNQIVDGGTATFHFDGSPDGTNWYEDLFSSKADSNFTAGANMALQIGTLSDANGMPTYFEQLRVRCTASTAGGEYTMGVTGVQRAGWSG